MELEERYAAIVRKVIQEYADFGRPAHGDIRVETVFDDTRRHYQLVYSGWNNRRRVHGAVLHIDIRDGKVWIEHDGTEDGVADELLAAGIPYEHIVLGFHHPSKRPHTPFAVG